MNAFIIRFQGGPHPIDVLEDEDHYPDALPGIILNEAYPGGMYVKLTEGEDTPRTQTRIAVYEWQVQGGPNA